MNTLGYNDGSDSSGTGSHARSTRGGAKKAAAGGDGAANPPRASGSSRPGTDADRRAGFDSHASQNDTRTDEQLLASYRGGDKQAFATLVSRYQRELFHLLVRFLGDRA